MKDYIVRLRTLKEKYGMKFYDPTTYERDSKERKKLEWVADYVTEHTGIVCWVADTYFDFGQGWKWTTIIAKEKSWNYQLLAPAEQGLVMCEGAEQDVADYITEKIKKGE